MAYDALFDTEDNRALIAICTRKLIANIGVGGILWGVINIAIGIVAMQTTLLNTGLLILGVMMLGTGVQAIRRPSLGVLLTETVVTVLLFLWNLGISVLNTMALGVFDPQGLIFPLIIAVAFANYYRKLGHLRTLIASVEPERIKATKQMCKTLLKKKLKNEPSVVQTRAGTCRAQMVDESAFFIQRDMMRAFVGSKEDIRKAIAKPDAKRLKMVFNHPVGKLTYQFDKKNSEKLKNWLATETAPTSESA
jgi:hypothetical protein